MTANNIRQPRLFQSALGIETGDLVTTSNGTGPYDVWSISYSPFVQKYPDGLVVRDQPAICLTCISGLKDGPPGARFYLNHIRLHEGRYLMDNGDEVFIRQRAKERPGLEFQIDMFSSNVQPGSPYSFQPGVNYDAGDGHVWQCAACGRDFNAERRDIQRPRCPHCDAAGPLMVRVLTSQWPHLRVKKGGQ